MAEMIHEAQPHKRIKPTQPALAGDPGYGLGIAGFIVSFFSGLVGLILSAVALRQSRNAGLKNGFALAGLIIGIIKTVFETLAIAGMIIFVVSSVANCNAHPDRCHSDDSGYSHSPAYDNNGNSDGSTDQTY